MYIQSQTDNYSVKNKMKNGDGMSFAEFTYPLLQAWDWWHMYQTNKSIHMQIGGSDQFGNITAGIDAIKYMSANHPNPIVREEVRSKGEPFGFTVPLLTTSSGQKFGKSAGNAIWLDPDQTSPFELYKFFLGTSDADVGKYLKLFTFMPIEQIDALVEDHMKSPPQRKAQHALARDFVELVHGEHEAKFAESQHRLVFSKGSLSPDDTAAAQVDGTVSSPPDANLRAGITTLNNRTKANIKLPRSLIEKTSIPRILYACGLVESTSQGHKLLAAHQAVYIGARPSLKEPMNDAALDFTPVKIWRTEDTQKFLIDDKLLILRKGKSNIRIIEVVSDEEYEKSGLTYPGMPTADAGSSAGAPVLDVAHNEPSTAEQCKSTGGVVSADSPSS
jgi:tyrosyl-tRNA synthetase